MIMKFRVLRSTSLLALLFWGLTSPAWAAPVPAVLQGDLQVTGSSSHATIQFEVGSLAKLALETSSLSESDSMVHVKSATSGLLRVGPGENNQMPVLRLDITTVDAPIFLRFTVITEPGASLTLNIAGLDPITVQPGVTQTFSYGTYNPPAK